MSKSLVFITGATGFIGTHVVAATLKAGYRVRLSIRKAEQEAGLRKRWAEFNSDIEILVIPDLSNVDSLKAALYNVDYIFHIASPMPGSGNDLERDYVIPAVKATLSMLNAALAHKQIQRVVIVSSLLSLAVPDALISKNVVAKENTGEVIYVDPEMTFAEGFAGHGLRYAVSKIRAHQATRDFLKTENPHYKILTLHPSFVLGEDLNQTTAAGLAGMNNLFYQSLLSEQPRIGNVWAHVRDVADVHVKALQADAESGTEFIISHPPVSWEDEAKFVKEKYPSLGCKLQPPFTGGWDVYPTAAEQILGIKWRSPETIIEDVVNQQLALKAQEAAV
ncbi:NAD(P)-binding protein [Penicillium verhagenii]|uniref:NAD(P)-binding protein n=1 Tax=Penicillium verhagenii TaxID=1562060 RepID=UPI00254587C6|nr:NAD(P)-binding protein [Penicillium verhagenii]KAJ5919098.1 NAD(P)-binding protein [Penicillium verhagenii]